MRLRRRGDTRDRLQSSDRVILEPASYQGRWQEAFRKAAPLHVELGMGKGRFISELSRRHPECNFIGMDMYDELVRKAIDKAALAHGGKDPDNLVCVLGNIERIGDFFAEHEVSRIYLNHSDPWPKHRHAARRLTHPRFMAHYLRILEPGGQIHFKTDSLSLFEYSLNVFAELNLTMRRISLDVHREGTPPDYIFTEYEQKFMDQGMNIYRVEIWCQD